MNKAKYPIDLIVTASLAVLGAVVSLIGLQIPVLRAILGFSLIMILPGFAIWSALFPKRSPGAVEQVLIIGGLSIFLAGLVGLLLDRSRVGLHTSSWAITLCVITLVACWIAWMRRESLGVGSPSLPRLNLTWSQGALLGLAGLLIVGAVRLARMPTSQLSEFQGYSILWMLPAGNDAPNTVRVGLISNEFEKTKYNLRLTVDNKTVHAWENIQLVPGEKWDDTYKLPAKYTASTRVEALLYKLDNPASVYRRVWVSLEP